MLDSVIIMHYQATSTLSKICVCRDRRPVSRVHHSDLLPQPDLSEVDEVGAVAPPFLSFPLPRQWGEGETLGGIAVREPALAGHLHYLRAQGAPPSKDAKTLLVLA